MGPQPAAPAPARALGIAKNGKDLHLGRGRGAPLFLVVHMRLTRSRYQKERRTSRSCLSRAIEAPCAERLST